MNYQCVKSDELTMMLLVNDKKHLSIFDYWMLQTDEPKLTCGFSSVSMLTVHALRKGFLTTLSSLL